MEVTAKQHTTFIPSSSKATSRTVHRSLVAAQLDQRPGITLSNTAQRVQQVVQASAKPPPLGSIAAACRACSRSWHAFIPSQVVCSVLVSIQPTHVPCRRVLLDPPVSNHPAPPTPTNPSTQSAVHNSSIADCLVGFSCKAICTSTQGTEPQIQAVAAQKAAPKMLLLLCPSLGHTTASIWLFNLPAPHQISSSHI